MTTVYHDADADLAELADREVAVIGYGNQGRSQALNLRDSGLTAVVGSIADESRKLAADEGFEAMDIALACERAQVVMLLIPDEVMPEVFRAEVAPGLSAGDLLTFASGYNVAFGLIEPAEELDVALVAPRMIGPGVRDTYLSGGGFPSFVGVHQDATGKALQRMLALAKGIGSTRAGCLELSMHDEATLDLFTEQGFGPAFGRVMMTAVETLVEAGYPPEAVLLELYLSGELAYTFEKIRQVGMLAQMDFHSQTSQYGSITRSGKFAQLGDSMKKSMQEVLQSIRSGEFAKEWSGLENPSELLEKIKSARDQVPMAEWERSARSVFQIK